MLTRCGPQHEYALKNHAQLLHAQRECGWRARGIQAGARASAQTQNEEKPLKKLTVTDSIAHL